MIIIGVFFCYHFHSLKSSKIVRVPRAPDEEDQSATGLLLRTYSAGPVSPICFTDLKGRELLRTVTLDDSTPQ